LEGAVAEEEAREAGELRGRHLGWDVDESCTAYYAKAAIFEGTLFGDLERRYAM
jgi:hypothetical protein